jgi:hypothetical protein
MTMQTPHRRPGFDLDVAVRVHAAGRRTPIGSGYRPVTVIEVDGKRTLIGLGELLLKAPIHPGSSHDGVLRFHKDVSDLVKSLLRPGSEVSFVEGERTVAFAEVIDIKQF